MIFWPHFNKGRLAVKILRWLFLLTVLLPAVLSAQERSVLQGERQLRKWTDLVADSNMVKMLSGEYFFFGPTDSERDLRWRIGYILQSRPDDPRDISFQLFGLFLPENLRVRIDNTKKIPTAEIIFTEALEIDRIIIRISKEDYKKSPCLEYVAKER